MQQPCGKKKSFEEIKDCLVFKHELKISKQIILAKLSPPPDSYIPHANFKYILNLIPVVT